MDFDGNCPISWINCTKKKVKIIRKICMYRKTYILRERNREQKAIVLDKIFKIFNCRELRLSYE